MPKPRVWTEDADMIIRAMRAAGATWSAIGLALGLSRNTVIERGRRLCATAPARTAALSVTRPQADDPNRDPLPAGHPLTWGLLSDEKFPKAENAWRTAEALVEPMDRRVA